MRLRVTGLQHAMTRNQQIQLPSDEATPSSAASGSAPSASSASATKEPPLRLCEPHERLLLAGFLDAYSTNLSTHTATYYGEVWLGEGRRRGVLGVQTQLQAQV